MLLELPEPGPTCLAISALSEAPGPRLRPPTTHLPAAGGQQPLLQPGPELAGLATQVPLALQSCA